MKLFNQKLTKTFISTLLLCASLTPIAQGAQDLIRDGFYRHIGFGVSYWRYLEVDSRNNDAFIMRIEAPMFNIAGNIGYVSANGVKFDGSIDANVAVPFSWYTGSTRDERDPNNDGKFVNQPDFSSYYRAQGLVGYNFLNGASERTTLYLQTGVGYFFSRNDSTPLERLQGYFHIPLQLESEIVLSNSLALNLMGGVNWVLFGNHLSRGTRENSTANLNTIQRKGLFGASGSVGLRYKTNAGNVSMIRLMYEYFRVGDSERSPNMYVWGGVDPVSYIEPKNSTHILTFQYFWSF
ncbi:hypothetical protein ACWIWK_00485 [Helicobacter sp. 23-1048]